MKRLWVLAAVAGCMTVAGCSSSKGSAAAPSTRTSSTALLGTGSPSVASSATAPDSTTLTVHAKKKGRKSEHGLLCIYPGAGAVRVIAPLARGISESGWSNACALNGGHPVERYGGTLYLEPFNDRFYKAFNRGAGGSLYVKPHRV